MCVARVVTVTAANCIEMTSLTRHHDKLTSGKDNIAVEVLPDIHVTLHDGVEAGLINACSLHADQAGCEEHLWAPESLAANCDDLHACAPMNLQRTKHGMYACDQTVEPVHKRWLVQPVGTQKIGQRACYHKRMAGMDALGQDVIVHFWPEVVQLSPLMCSTNASVGCLLPLSPCISMQLLHAHKTRAFALSLQLGPCLCQVAAVDTLKKSIRSSLHSQPADYRKIS